MSMRGPKTSMDKDKSKQGSPLQPKSREPDPSVNEDPISWPPVAWPAVYCNWMPQGYSLRVQSHPVQLFVSPSDNLYGYHTGIQLFVHGVNYQV